MPWTVESVWAQEVQLHSRNRRASARRAAVVLAFALAAWASPAPARADALYTYGFTPRAMAMGNAFVACADDYSAAYYNPAGMAFTTRLHSGIGYSAAGDNLRTLYADRSADLDRTRGLLVGTVIPLGFGSFLERRLAFGFSGYFPNGVVLAIKVPYPDTPQYALLQNAGRSLSLTAAVSLRVVDGLGVAGGAQLFDNTSGKIEAVIDPAGRIDATTGQELTTSYAPTAGLLIRPGEWAEALAGWSFGAVVREKFFTRYIIPVNSYVGGVPLRVDLHATSLFQPRHWVAGVAYARPGVFRVEADAAYNEWSDYPDPNLAIDVDFHIPLLPAEFRDSRAYDPGFHDTVSARAGGELKVWSRARAAGDFGLWTRAGYAWEPSPVPAQTGETNYMDSDRHAVSAGLGFEWIAVDATRSSLDVAFQYQQLERRVAWKSDGVAADNPGYPRIGVEGGLWAAGFSYSLEFDAQ